MTPAKFQFQFRLVDLLLFMGVVGVFLSALHSQTSEVIFSVVWCSLVGFMLGVTIVFGEFRIRRRMKELSTSSFFPIRLFVALNHWTNGLVLFAAIIQTIVIAAFFQRIHEDSMGMARWVMLMPIPFGSYVAFLIIRRLPHHPQNEKAT